MTLTDDEVYVFIELYRKEFGEILSFADAKRRAGEVMLLLQLLLDEDLADPHDD
jgi:hypothetical protein